ncbi:MAG: helix-turn-helix transcriptional regulator [Nocardiopsaceae bacterium]|jgi:DNA-binding CsgD family transcriptional regulator|nr:helix-turn-helix transcriptional regulator [Nocardiopsaceae bacterium]
MQPGVRRRRDELVVQVQRAPDAVGVFAAASARLRHLVPFDAAVWLTTDPGTGLPTAPTLADDLELGGGAEQCSELWRREFLVRDVILFRDIARAERPAAALRATVADPRQSARYREFMEPSGFTDELRAVLRVGDSPWGAINLFRRGGAAFTSPEIELVASLSAPLGEALRVRAQPAGPLGGPVRPDGPGVMVFGQDGALVSADEQASAWLAELPHDQDLPSDLGVPVPMWMLATVFRARAVAGGRGDGTARARVRTRRGLWLVCHASSLREAEGCLRSIAVVIEPAKAAEIAPIVGQAYDLTDREQQITRLIARGAGTAEISGELFLSAHTVRDYIKMIFRKVGVSSRGELVAKLFAEHYEPSHSQGVVRAHGN